MIFVGAFGDENYEFPGQTYWNILQDMKCEQMWNMKYESIPDN